jgi:AcrR family transcriptional regulator
MNTTTGTKEELLRTAQALFAERGYDGTSVRAITSAAHANLGAVTYHFGSKDALYDAVAESLMRPMRARIVETIQTGGGPLERIEALVRTVFHHLQSNPDLPRFMVQLLAGGRPVPPIMADLLRANHALIADLIATGQTEGTIRGGSPRLMALSIVAQPIWLAIVRNVLFQAIGLDQDDPHTRDEIVENAVRFVRAGLAPSPKES